MTHNLGFVGARDALVQICGPAERIIIPGDYGHATENLGEEPLVVCDLIASVCTNDYEFYRHMRGLAFYVVSDGDGFAIESNPRYPTPYPPEIAFGSNWPKELLMGAPLIELFRRDPGAFTFLTETRKYVIED